MTSAPRGCLSDAAQAMPDGSAIPTSLHVPLPAMLVGLGLLAGGVAQAGPAVGDDYTIRANTTLTASVVANDNITDPYSVDLLAPPYLAPRGTVTLQPDGELSYIPNPNFVGRDILQYRLTEMVETNVVVNEIVTEAFVSITVIPTATDDAFTTPVNTELTGVSVTDNDVLASDSITFIVTPPTHGTAVLQPSGQLSYTPNPGFTGVDTLRYQAVDPYNDYPNTFADVRITVAPSAQVTAVPTLGPLALGGLGALVALAGARRQRRPTKD